MKGQVNHHFVENSVYLGDAFLDGYGIKEVGTYPAAIPMKGFKIYGEVYEVDDKTKTKMDELEMVGYLYDCKEVMVHMDYISEGVLFYEYIRDTSQMATRLPFGKWNSYKRNIDDYVWYAVYGSNILKDRFMKYIAKTYSMKTPLLEKPFEFPYPIYFAKRSSGWNNGGVAFLDTQRKGWSPGWMYLITKEQFKEIHSLEGIGWYDLIVDLDKDETGIEIKTMTSSERYEYVKPSSEYMDIVAAGLMERKLFLQTDAIEDYFKEDYLPDTDEMHIKEILDRKK